MHVYELTIPISAYIGSTHSKTPGRVKNTVPGIIAQHMHSMILIMLCHWTIYFILKLLQNVLMKLKKAPNIPHPIPIKAQTKMSPM